MKSLQAILLKLRWGLLEIVPIVVDYFVYASTYFARRKLNNSHVLNILVDNTVIYHSVIHETKWISTGVQCWGTVPVDSGYMARVPVHGPSSDETTIENIKYLPGLRELHKQGLIRLWTSSELDFEQFCQPFGRYRGYGWYDYGLFREINLESIDGYGFEAICDSLNSRDDPVKAQRLRIKSYLSDSKFASIVRVLGEKNSQDAWHYYTAEKHKMFCFMTMDFKFIRNYQNQMHHAPINDMASIVISPADLGRMLKLLPISPKFFAYHGASYPVESGGEMDGGRRRPLKKYKK